MTEVQPAVTRFEVIDHAPGAVSYHPDVARSLVARDVKVELSVQDGGRTLKVFLTRLDAVCPKCGTAGCLRSARCPMGDT